MNIKLIKTKIDYEQALERLELILMLNENLNAVNSFENAINVSPIEKELNIDIKKKMISITLPAQSFSVYRFKVLTN